MFGVKPAGFLVGLAAAIFTVAACGGSSSSGGTTPVDVGSAQITGAGSSFTEPFYTKAFYAYSQAHSSVTVNYQPVGSGAGISQFQAGTVDFGASDVPMGAADITKAGGADSLVQIPTTLGVVSIAYNLPGVTKLQLDGPTLAAIYLKHITMWNDPAIAALNSGVTLPSTAINVVHRSDGSGTTYIFTDYLSKVSDEWKTKVGVGKAVSWPVGTGGAQTAGVAQAITNKEGSIGYVELAYVIQTGMSQAYLKNQNGKFLQASQAGASAAAAQNTTLSATNFSITNEPGDTSYPIAGFTWAILKTNYTDASKGKAIVLLFKWLTSAQGQNYGKDLEYAPLPSAVSALALTSLKSIKAGGSTVIS